MQMFKSKRGFIQLALSLPFLILIVVLSFLLIGFLILTGYFLSKNIFLLMGLFLVLMGGLGFIKGFPIQAGLTLIGVGILVLLLPTLFDGLAGITLASVLP